MKKNAKILEINSNTDNEILLHHVSCLLILGSIFASPYEYYALFAQLVAVLHCSFCKRVSLF